MELHPLTRVTGYLIHYPKELSGISYQLSITDQSFAAFSYFLFAAQKIAVSLYYFNIGSGVRSVISSICACAISI